ncbi:FAD-dependent monooxygenase [Rhodanobacter sp. AS-Z3]|uniref:FAD-dependent monooxygenase n=1 Tax=Rhodanobacter sp. AS-Z3 TaxID=3031330 RepID=UPI00247AA0DC|nr:FAD-dependent monooxygenase [Rhodanobacter sp. AS-Z3]WEN13818.1 FAD-dependent monooxygenase [Rhodanobacter sp. AS-Z3]
MIPILIVGAGPVGLTMAVELTRFGVPVRILDRAAHATETSRALVLWARTLELMDRAGCTASFIEQGLCAHGATMRSGGMILGRTRFDDLASNYNFALMLPQSETERLLAEWLGRHGVAVEREVELVGFADAGEQVNASLRHADGRVETVTTPWLLGCDGAHSTVRHGLGVEFSGSTDNDDWLLADVRMEGDGAPPRDEAAIYLHADGPFALFPMRGGRVRAVGRIGHGDPAHPRDEPTLADVQTMIDQRTGGGFHATDPLWLANFRINERMVEDYRYGRVLLAGDAAHIHSPAGGQGMNTGMQDAINLAWKLAQVVAGHAGNHLLDSYSSERRKVGARVLLNATRLTRAANLSNPLLQAARNQLLKLLLGFHGIRHAMGEMLSEIDIAYAGSPLSVGPHAGDRLPPDQYDGPAPGTHAARFVLYAADAATGDALAARYPAWIEARSRRPHDPGQLLIVRPDGYTGLVARANDWKAAAHYLDRLTG